MLIIADNYLHLFNFVTAAVRRHFNATDKEIRTAVGTFLGENGDPEAGRLSHSERRRGRQLVNEEQNESVNEEETYED